MAHKCKGAGSSSITMEFQVGGASLLGMEAKAEALARTLVEAEGEPVFWRIEPASAVEFVDGYPSVYPDMYIPPVPHRYTQRWMLVVAHHVLDSIRVDGAQFAAMLKDGVPEGATKNATLNALLQERISEVWHPPMNTNWEFIPEDEIQRIMKDWPELYCAGVHASVGESDSSWIGDIL